MENLWMARGQSPREFAIDNWKRYSINLHAYSVQNPINIDIAEFLKQKFQSLVQRERRWKNLEMSLRIVEKEKIL